MVFYELHSELVKKNNYKSYKNVVIVIYTRFIYSTNGLKTV